MMHWEFHKAEPCYRLGANIELWFIYTSLPSSMLRILYRTDEYVFYLYLRNTIH